MRNYSSVAGHYRPTGSSGSCARSSPKQRREVSLVLHANIPGDDRSSIPAEFRIVTSQDKHWGTQDPQGNQFHSTTPTTTSLSTTSSCHYLSAVILHFMNSSALHTLLSAHGKKLQHRCKQISTHVAPSAKHSIVQSLYFTAHKTMTIQLHNVS